jgi:hypothetical protein
VRHISLRYFLLDPVLRNRLNGNAFPAGGFSAFLHARWQHYRLMISICTLWWCRWWLRRFIGDAFNCTLGRLFGEKLFRCLALKINHHSYLDKTHLFYEKYREK